jgi:hypothetical protein
MDGRFHHNTPPPLPLPPQPASRVAPPCSRTSAPTCATCALARAAPARPQPGVLCGEGRECAGDAAPVRSGTGGGPQRPSTSPYPPSHLVNFPYFPPFALPDRRQRAGAARRVLAGQKGAQNRTSYDSRMRLRTRIERLKGETNPPIQENPRGGTSLAAAQRVGECAHPPHRCPLHCPDDLVVCSSTPTVGSKVTSLPRACAGGARPRPLELQLISPIPSLGHCSARVPAA